MNKNKQQQFGLGQGLAAALASCLMVTGCGPADGTKEAAKGGGAAAPAAKVTSVQNIGSDTMVNLAQSWAEHYHTVDPTVSVEVSGGGSGIGVAALINGTCDIANSSRAPAEWGFWTNLAPWQIETSVSLDGVRSFGYETNMPRRSAWLRNNGLFAVITGTT